MNLKIAEASKILGISRQNLYDRAFKVEGVRGKVINIVEEVKRLREYEFERGKQTEKKLLEASKKAGALSPDEVNEILSSIARQANGVAALNAIKVIREDIRENDLSTKDIEIDIAFVPIAFDGENFISDKSKQIILPKNKRGY